MKDENKKPKWLDKKKEINEDKHEEVLEFIGERGADGVIDGKLPNGEPYLWFKRR